MVVVVAAAAVAMPGPDSPDLTSDEIDAEEPEGTSDGVQGWLGGPAADAADAI